MTNTASSIVVLKTFFILLALLGVAASGKNAKSESKQVQNITLTDAEDRLDELKEMLTDRLMQIDSIRSELGGREASCSAQDQECSAYYRVGL
jgi:hypothetical protein